MCCNSGHHPEISRPLSGLHHKGTHRAPLSTCWTHIEQFYNNDGRGIVLPNVEHDNEVLARQRSLGRGSTKAFQKTIRKHASRRHGANRLPSPVSYGRLRDCLASFQPSGFGRRTNSATTTCVAGPAVLGYRAVVRAATIPFAVLADVKVSADLDPTRVLRSPSLGPVLRCFAAIFGTLLALAFSFARLLAGPPFLVLNLLPRLGRPVRSSISLALALRKLALAASLVMVDALVDLSLPEEVVLPQGLERGLEGLSFVDHSASMRCRAPRTSRTTRPGRPWSHQTA